MSTGHRLPPQPGEWIDRSKPISFTFEGKPCEGFVGDTITTALAASGVRVLGRSFKYHRPRSIYSLANHDVNVMVEDGTDTNIRGDVTPVRDGAAYRAVNTFGGLENDRLRIMDKFSRFLPVGFYYKTFFRPQRMFPFWENQMRKAAGLGTIDTKAPASKTPKRYDWRDVVVIGAGPAGLSAAIAAAESGAKVLVVDENARPGGSLTYQHSSNPEAARILADLLARAARLLNLQIFTNTFAAGYYADHWIALVDNDKLTKLRARSVVIAQGAFEQPTVFRHNDLPGVMLASGAQRLIKRYGVKPCENAVIVTANSQGYAAAFDLLAAHCHVAAVIDLRPDGEHSELAKKVSDKGVKVHKGEAVYEAIPGPGLRTISGVITAQLDAHGHADTDHLASITCDGVLMSCGWAGCDGLLYQAGGRMTYSEDLEQFIPATLPLGVFAAGRVNGVFELSNQLQDGTRAGAAAANHTGFTTAAPTTQVPRGPRSTHPYPIFYHPKGKAFLDLDEDVQLKDVVNADKEGFDNIELLKRYSTFGMGPSQGKIANINTTRVLAKLRGQTVAQTGTPTARPFWHPVEIKHLAGRGFHPHHHTPMHSRHVSAGALMMAAGEWLRPAFYAPGKESKQHAITAEVSAVRERVGIIDVGTLGKIEVSGPDAGEFLDRIYTAKFKSMPVGTTRYGLMCDESGIIIDDGIVARLGDDRFYITTTTTASSAIYREMQRWAMVWKLAVTLVNATGLLGGMNLAGPSSRNILRELVDFDISDAAFPYLGVRQGKVLGVPARFMRVGFVGELGYEIHVPAYSACRVWDGLIQAGKRAGIRPFGVEAQRVLRLEKGHVIVSQDTDGLTTPFEAHMDWAVKDDKPFFIGQRSLRIVRRKPATRKLVGFTLGNDHHGPLPKECHLIIDGDDITGRVTSIVQSPTLGKAIGLAYVGMNQAAVGSHLSIRLDDGEMISATVVPIPFYDPKALRQKT